LICNAHAISVMEHDWENDEPGESAITKMSECKIASAIYPTASLMNHSCRPNIFSR
jgi:hypothetical protein